MHRNSTISALLAAVLVVACNGNESPTAPTAAPSKTALSAAARTPASGSAVRRRAVSPVPSSSTVLSFSITTTSSHTLREVRLTFDGRVVATVEQPGGSARLTIKGTVNAASGPHIIGLIIADQASSPNEYRAIGSITTPTRIYDLAPVEASVKTGEALEIRVTL